MLKVFPMLKDARIEYSWGGYVDITLNRAPDFGRLQRDVYYLQGFSGHGIALTGLAGKLVAEAIAGSAERFDVFARIPHREFPGGALLRRPALVLAMLYYRLQGPALGSTQCIVEQIAANRSAAISMRALRQRGRIKVR